MHKRFVLMFLSIMLLFPLFLPKSTRDFDKEYSEYRTRRVNQIIYRYGYNNNKKTKDTLSKIYDYSVKYDISFDIFASLVFTESHFDSMAVSDKGAIGLCQIMPKTARYLANILDKKHYNLYNRDDNLDLGAFYLSALLHFCQPKEALARYYAGNNWSDYTSSRYVKSILIFF